jgi:hypothetical protein
MKRVESSAAYGVERRERMQLMAVMRDFFILHRKIFFLVSVSSFYQEALFQQQNFIFLILA